MTIFLTPYYKNPRSRGEDCVGSLKCPLGHLGGAQIRVFAEFSLVKKSSWMCCLQAEVLCFLKIGVLRLKSFRDGSAESLSLRSKRLVGFDVIP